MFVTKEMDLLKDTWSGAQEAIVMFNNNGDLEEVEEMLSEYFAGAIPSITKVNDFIWFYTDTICQWLGYEDEEDYINKHQESKAV